MSLRWQHYPRSQPPSELCGQVVDVFRRKHSAIDSRHHDRYGSNKALSILAEDFRSLGFRIEKKGDKIKMPVLFGKNGRTDKSFYPDGYQAKSRYILEVEAASGVTNYHFFRDLFQACTCDSVDSLAIAVRNDYKGSDDFFKVCAFMDAVFISRRFALPLKEVLIIGY